MRTMFSIFALAPLTACMVTPGGQPGTGEPAMQCRDDRLNGFIGQTYTEDLGRRMLSAAGARTIRVVPKGGVVTMDFRGDRLTVQLDEANRVETARCG
jgi:hypothetical protein